MLFNLFVGQILDLLIICLQILLNCWILHKIIPDNVSLGDVFEVGVILDPVDVVIQTVLDQLVLMDIQQRSNDVQSFMRKVRGLGDWLHAIQSNDT
ncbi:hypothetical protein WICPIJ_000639 [Wickerhamomyces pijperi]|uniref:Uncharacterized protein n=1 Tax=Wickerhamomyces pijperi TaxID=599730 RepID=A0A9P8TSA1_WICPI|nr:hypothetical protein WICPIJ_000639 [Wickerhamomyces pijperi]